MFRYSKSKDFPKHCLCTYVILCQIYADLSLTYQNNKSTYFIGLFLLYYVTKDYIWKILLYNIILICHCARTIGEKKYSTEEFEG